METSTLQGPWGGMCRPKGDPDKRTNEKKDMTMKTSSNNKYLRRTFPALAIASFLISSLAGQGISLSVDTQAGQVANLFGSRLVGDQSMAYGNAYMAFHLQEDLRITGSFAHTAVMTNQNYSSGKWQAGLQWRKIDHPRHQFYAGFSLSAFNYAPVYDYYDHSLMSGYVEWKHTPHRQWYVKLGYDLSGRSFIDEPQASNTVHRLYALGLASFNTGTALKTELDFSVQDFWKPDLQATGGGQWYTAVPLYEELPTNLLISGSLRLSQSLHSKIGLAGKASYQGRLNRDPKGANVLDGLVSPFIDRFRWEGQTLESQLTIIFPLEVTLVPSVWFQTRYYVDVPVYRFDFETNTYFVENEEYVLTDLHRSDRQTIYQLKIRKAWHLPFDNILDTAHTNLVLGWVDNQSNDPLFQYAGRFITLGLQFNYQQ